jgi:hypothetical protein
MGRVGAAGDGARGPGPDPNASAVADSGEVRRAMERETLSVVLACLIKAS